MKMHYDFRTKLWIILMVMILVAFISSDFLIFSLIIVLSIYLFIQGYGKAVFRYIGIGTIFFMLRFYSEGQGITFLMPEMFLFMVLRFMLMIMAAHPVIGLPPGEIAAVFKKCHIPVFLALPVTFMLRFIPTVRSQFTDVFVALRLRGLISWRHPLKTMEYVVTPIIFRSSRIADELAASSESRGISYPGIHTSRRQIIFGFSDGLMCAAAFVITVIFIWMEWGLIR